jgi:type 1 fimbriae regulatory protein FimB/type 1 fimbriae regulatory protein FimE
MNTNASQLALATADEIAPQSVPQEEKNIPENAPKWESSPAGGPENPRIVEVAFEGPNTPKRESSNNPPRRVPNAERRSREYLTEAEVEKLMAAAEGIGRHGHRDATIILIAYRHALRVSEIISLRWEQVDLAQGLLHVNRVKNGTPATHPLRGPELRALRRLQRDYGQAPYVFTGERKGPMTTSGIRKIVARAGMAAGIPFPVHPHMLRHAAGYRLANDGQDTRAIQCYLGHRNITHTVRYTELSPDRFKSFWQD